MKLALNDVDISGLWIFAQNPDDRTLRLQKHSAWPNFVYILSRRDFGLLLVMTASNLHVLTSFGFLHSNCAVWFSASTFSVMSSIVASSCFCVMPMEIFVVARVDLATFGKFRVARDLSLLSTLVCFCSLFACETREGGKFHPDLRLRSGRVEFLRNRGDSSTPHEGTRLWLYICGRSVSVLPDFSRFSGHICNSWVFFHQ